MTMRVVRPPRRLCTQQRHEHYCYNFLRLERVGGQEKFGGLLILGVPEGTGESKLL